MRLIRLIPGLVAFAACLHAAAADGWRPLWNGKNIDGWSTWLDVPHASTGLPTQQPIGPDHDPTGVFSMVNTDGQPALRISGQIFGELRTRESFSNYHLKLQFKWGAKKWPPREAPATPRDSGLLYHVHGAAGEDGFPWARSVELQIQERDVGDLYAIRSQVSVRSKRRMMAGGWSFYAYDPKGEWNVFSMYGFSEGRCVKQPDNEKPSGEWNTIELVCFGDESIHIVNGQVVMRLRGARSINGPLSLPVRSGPIILQSEGAEIFYRDIAIRPITAIPAEYAEK